MCAAPGAWGSTRTRRPRPGARRGSRAGSARRRSGRRRVRGPRGRARSPAAPAVWARRARCLAGEGDAPAHRADEPRDHSQRRRLAGPVRAEQRHHLARADGQVEVADHRRPVVAGGQALDAEQGVGQSRRLPAAARPPRSRGTPRSPAGRGGRRRACRARSPSRTRARPRSRRSRARAPCRGRRAASPCPASTTPRRWRASSSLSRVSRPAAGSSRQRSRGSAASARAIPTSLRCPCVRSSGIASAVASRPRSSSAASAAFVLLTGLESTSLTVAQADGR